MLLAHLRSEGEGQEGVEYCKIFVETVTICGAAGIKTDTELLHGPYLFQSREGI